MLISAFFTARPGAEEPVLLLPPWAGSMAALGGSSIESGALAGVPIVIAASLGANAVILDANAVAYAGQDDIRIDYSYEAALELTDAPADPTTAASVITSLWQNNLAALRVE